MQTQKKKKEKKRNIASAKPVPPGKVIKDEKIDLSLRNYHPNKGE